MGGTVDANDTEGRILVTKYDGLTCINTYLPSGSNKEERQRFKESWMDEWRQWLQPFLALETPVIVCGDLNIAHTEDDIWNAKGNKKSSGFLPQERQWFSDLLTDGWSDVFPRTCWRRVIRNTHGGPIEGRQESKIEAGESITSLPTQRLQV